VILQGAAWGLRDNVAARDGLYVAAAQALSAAWSPPTIGSRERYPT